MSPISIAMLATPEKATAALELYIKTYDIEIGDELAGLLMAKDDKGRSKLIELVAKSKAGGEVATAEEHFELLRKQGGVYQCWEVENTTHGARSTFNTTTQTARTRPLRGLR